MSLLKYLNRSIDILCIVATYKTTQNIRYIGMTNIESNITKFGQCYNSFFEKKKKKLHSLHY